MVYIIHGLFHTGERWEYLAQRIGDATSMYYPDLPSIDEIAQALAPKIIGADTIIGHSAGGLVLHRMIEQGYIEAPPNIVFVATPFTGIKALRQMESFLFLARLPRIKPFVRYLASYTVQDRKFIDRIMYTDAIKTNTPNQLALLREVIRYNCKPLKTDSKQYVCEGEKDWLVEKVNYPGAIKTTFKEVGHTLMLEDETRFVEFIRWLRSTS